MPGETVMHGCYHVESFVCPFCSDQQVAKTKDKLPSAMFVAGHKYAVKIRVLRGSGPSLEV